MEPEKVKSPDINNEETGQGPKWIRTVTQLTPDDMINSTVPAEKRRAAEERMEQDVTVLNPDPHTMEGRG